MDNAAEAGAKADSQGAGNPGDSSTPVTNPGQSTSPSGQTGVTPEGSQNTRLDIENHPAFRGMRKENQRYKGEIDKLRQEFAQQKAYLEGMGRSNGSQTPGVSDEDTQALKKVFKAAFDSPEVMEMLKQGLGLTKLSELDKNYQSLSQDWYGRQAESEMSEVLKDAKELGLDPEAIREEIESALESHPVFSKVDNYYQGAIKEVYRSLTYDRVGELKQRAATRKQIEEREALKRGQTQTSSAQGTPGKAGSADQKFGEAYREGIVFGR